MKNKYRLASLSDMYCRHTDRNWYISVKLSFLLKDKILKQWYCHSSNTTIIDPYKLECKLLLLSKMLKQQQKPLNTISFWTNFSFLGLSLGVNSYFTIFSTSFKLMSTTSSCLYSLPNRLLPTCWDGSQLLLCFSTRALPQCLFLTGAGCPHSCLLSADREQLFCKIWGFTVI